MTQLQDRERCARRTMLVRDDLWPEGSDPDAARQFAREVLLDPDLFG